MTTSTGPGNARRRALRSISDNPTPSLKDGLTRRQRAEQLDTPRGVRLAIVVVALIVTLTTGIVLLALAALVKVLWAVVFG